MTPLGQVFREQGSNINIILRMAVYEMKSRNQMNYLGILWQFLNPAFQIVIYWFVFGIGIRKGIPVNGVPFFVWFITGMIPWFFISPAIVQGSNSVYSKINLVSKMKFPVSILPTISIVSNLFNFIVMMGVVGLVLFFYKINPGLYLIQLLYYMICFFIFVFAVSLFCSTLIIIIRDFQQIIQFGMRMLFFVLPVLWDTSKLSHSYFTMLKMNPMYYLIDGFRNSFLGKRWFFDDMSYTIYFWSITLLILLFGAAIHVKFRDKFIDYL